LGYSALVGLGVSFPQSQALSRDIFQTLLLGFDNWFPIASWSDHRHAQPTKEGRENHRQTSQIDNGGASGYSFDQDVWLGSFLHPADLRISREGGQNGSKIFVWPIVRISCV